MLPALTGFLWLKRGLSQYATNAAENGLVAKVLLDQIVGRLCVTSRSC
jgi:hypothetical protein